MVTMAVECGGRCCNDYDGVMMTVPTMVASAVGGGTHVGSDYGRQFGDDWLR